MKVINPPLIIEQRVFRFALFNRGEFQLSRIIHANDQIGTQFIGMGTLMKQKRDYEFNLPILNVSPNIARNIDIEAESLCAFPARAVSCLIFYQVVDTKIEIHFSPRAVYAAPVRRCALIVMRVISLSTKWRK